MNSRWFEMKKMIFGLLLLLALVSCTSQKVTTTPKITATAIAFDQSTQNIAKVIEQTFAIETCSKQDLLNNEDTYHYSVDHPVLIEASQNDLEKVKVEEISDNKSGDFRAYLVDEPSPQVCDSCVLSRVFLENRVSKQVYKIDWKDYVFTRYLSNLVWIGDSVLAMRQANDLNTYELYGINVESKDFVYLSIISCK